MQHEQNFLTFIHARIPLWQQIGETSQPYRAESLARWKRLAKVFQKLLITGSYYLRNSSGGAGNFLHLQSICSFLQITDDIMHVTGFMLQIITCHKQEHWLTFFYFYFLQSSSDFISNITKSGTFDFKFTRLTVFIYISKMQ